jgi:hypothetical protein
MHFRHIFPANWQQTSQAGIGLRIYGPPPGSVATTLSRNEIPVRRRSLLDAVAAANGDPRLCVVIEYFYRKQRSRIGVDLRTLKHTNLVISDTHE